MSKTAQPKKPFRARKPIRMGHDLEVLREAEKAAENIRRRFAEEREDISAFAKEAGEAMREISKQIRMAIDFAGRQYATAPMPSKGKDRWIPAKWFEGLVSRPIICQWVNEGKVRHTYILRRLCVNPEDLWKEIVTLRHDEPLSKNLNQPKDKED